MDHPDHPVLDRRPRLERILGPVPGIRWLIGGIVAVTLACAIVIRVIDAEEFPTLGRALWWSVQTVTTVGYGDVTPQTTEGQIVAGLLMVAAVALISILTASIAAGFVNRFQRRRAELHQDPMYALLESIDRRLEQLEKRFESS